MRSISCDLPSERLAPSYISCSLRPGGRACRAGGAGGRRARGQLRGRGARLTGARRAARGGTWPGGVVWGVGPLATGGPPTAQGLPRGGAPLDRLERPPTSERVTLRSGGCITPWKQGAPATVPPLSGKCPAGVPQVSRSRINILPGCPAGVPQVSRKCPAGAGSTFFPQVSRKCPAAVGVPQVSRKCPAGVPQVSRDRNRVFPECPARCPASIPRVSRGRINVVPRRPPRRCDTPCSASCRYRCPCIGAARRVYRRCVRCYNNEKYSPSNYIEIIIELYLSFNKHLLCKSLNALRSSSTLSAEHCYIGRLTMSARNRLWIIRLVMSTCNHLWMRPTQLPHTRQCQDPPKMPRLTASSQPLEPPARPLPGRPASSTSQGCPASRVNKHKSGYAYPAIGTLKKAGPPWKGLKKKIRHHAPPGGPPWKSALEGLQIRRPTGLRSVARNNKATRLLTRPGPTAKSSAKDLSLARCKIAIRWLSDLRFRGSPAASLLRSGAGAYPHPPSARRGESPVPAWILT